MEKRQLAHPVFEPHGEGFLGRRDVVSRIELRGRVRELEEVVDCVGRSAKGVAATHR